MQIKTTLDTASCDAESLKASGFQTRTTTRFDTEAAKKANLERTFEWEEE